MKYFTKLAVSKELGQRAALKALKKYESNPSIKNMKQFAFFSKRDAAKQIEEMETARATVVSAADKIEATMGFMKRKAKGIKPD